MQLDKKINELKASQNQMTQQSSFVMDKYASKHNNNHQQNKVINSTVNKSGQNLTANFNRGAQSKNGVPQTQRNSGHIMSSGAGSATGRNTAKPSIICNSLINNTNQSVMSTTQQTYGKENSSSVGKQSVSGVNQKIIHDRMNDKENHQRLSNKTKSHSTINDMTNTGRRTKTAEGA